MYDYLIVGAGLYGAVFAREVTDRGKTCLIIDKRDHIGGNVYTEQVEGINVHKYGAHIFHANDQEIWDYVNRFARFNRYTNSPVANYRGELYNLPFNMNTFNKMWGVITPQEAMDKIDEQKRQALSSLAGVTPEDDEAAAARKIENFTPSNLEEQAISLIGTDIYEKLVKGYTQKQWGRPCTQLPAFIIKRLPVRFTFDNNYFNASWQGIPIGGYTKMVENIIGDIPVKLGVDYLKLREDKIREAGAQEKLAQETGAQYSGARVKDSQEAGAQYSGARVKDPQEAGAQYSGARVKDSQEAGAQYSGARVKDPQEAGAQYADAHSAGSVPAGLGIAKKLVFTGPIDQYFDYKLGILKYRSVRFETELLDIPNYQGNAVINYTDAETPYTRIIEHKHFEFGKAADGSDLPKTVISREYSAEWQPGTEPYYPVNDAENSELYLKYKALADSQEDVIFGGRLGEYKYYDMDQVIRMALDASAKETTPH